MFWIVTYEPIEFDIKYPYMYRFDKSCHIWVYLFSKVTSRIVIYKMPHALPSLYRILFSMLRKVLEELVQLFYSAVIHLDHMIPF